jgi:hypothetical protein
VAERRPRKDANEIARLQSEISNEISRDAPEIATMVFGEAKDQPDVVSLSNERLDQIYRDAYARDDRPFLQQEARRDPDQFLKVAERIGVQRPPPMPTPVAGFKPSSVPQALPQPALAPAAAPTGAVWPVPPPVPVAPVAPPQAPPIPVILGPNGQPLPPNGVV